MYNVSFQIGSGNQFDKGETKFNCIQIFLAHALALYTSLSLQDIAWGKKPLKSVFIGKTAVRNLRHYNHPCGPVPLWSTNIQGVSSGSQMDDFGNCWLFITSDSWVTSPSQNTCNKKRGRSFSSYNN